MSRKKRIAVAYLFALPLSLAIVFYQRSAINAAKGPAAEVRAAGSVIQETDEILALLREAQTNAEAYLAPHGGSANIASYRDSVSKIQKTLQSIGEQTKDEQSVQASFRDMSDLVSRQIKLLNKAVAGARGRTTSGARADGGRLSQELVSGVVKDRAAINAVQRTRLEQQGEASRRSLRRAEMTTVFGGGLLVWLVATAAFLLFHQERARVWAGVERRVHTKVLQILPVGVSVTTDTGVILYLNPAEESLLGCNPGELLGKDATKLHDLDGPASEPIVNSILERLDANEVWTGELPVRRKDGTIQKTPAWVMNLEFPGKIYRLFVHRTG